MLLYKLLKNRCAVFFGYLTVAINSCTPTSNQYPSALKERATLKFTYDNKEYEGIAVIPRKSYHKIRFNLPDKTRELVIATCHREEFYKLNSPKFYDYSYIPVAFLENWDSCFLIASAHTENGKKQFALIDFTSNETLEANLYCNGKKFTSNVSFCQAKTGTTQMISAKVKVKARGSSCDAPLTDYGASEGFSFFVKVQSGYCIYTLNSGNKIHRLTIYGY